MMRREFPFRTTEDILANAEAAETRAGHAIEAARTRLIAEVSKDPETEEIIKIVTEELSLSRERRLRMYREALVGVQEMEGVVRTLNEHMQMLSSQLNKMAEHTSVATAYIRNAHRD
jgi:hypothetical protein